MCTAIRVCLMKHLACEDQELWPLFTTYFTVQEQEQVIGAIVGRSSAEVLQVMLPLIQAETNPRVRAPSKPRSGVRDCPCAPKKSNEQTKQTNS